jgi:hypothetical protein
MHVHLAARDQEVLDAAHVAADPQARGHRRQQVEADDAAVDPAEMAHPPPPVLEGELRKGV